MRYSHFSKCNSRKQNGPSALMKVGHEANLVENSFCFPNYASLLVLLKYQKVDWNLQKDCFTKTSNEANNPLALVKEQQSGKHWIHQTYRFLLRCEWMTMTRSTGVSSWKVSCFLFNSQIMYECLDKVGWCISDHICQHTLVVTCKVKCILYLFSHWVWSRLNYKTTSWIKCCETVLWI